MTKRTDTFDAFLGFIAILGLCAVALCVGAWRAAARAEAFNRLTGSHISAWDSFFLDLRVQAPPVAP